ncbi:hypothetical protein LPY66_07660 [Dehalobacter sp. DCM]|uniref:hypothetical protein n=1 Tax=Dehalobacter sp. DCM TaxID=2907827 RepID=UPI0030819713|nr:hypothetical protein LPY66_07660 [Dehalobacter sp. DCM]
MVALLYRIKQFLNALWPSVRDSEYTWIYRELSEAEATLFTRQTLTDQRHALDVAYDIQNQKRFIEMTYGSKDYQNLLHAALLHDCGKALIALHLWQRIFIVLFGHFPANIKKEILAQRSLLTKTLIIYQQHPVWGKRLAFKAGVNPDIQTFILNHHAPTSPKEKILYMADNRN